MPDDGNCLQDYTVSHSERRRRENVTHCSPAARHGRCSRCTVVAAFADGLPYIPGENHDRPSELNSSTLRR